MQHVTSLVKHDPLGATRLSLAVDIVFGCMEVPQQRWFVKLVEHVKVPFWNTTSPSAGPHSTQATSVVACEQCSAAGDACGANETG